MSLRTWLQLPESRRVENLDDPATTALHRAIIMRKPFLKRVYIEFYQRLASAFPDGTQGKTIVELGSGGGFISEVLPGVITSDIIPLPWVQRCFSALDMPFGDTTLDGIFMINVFHHIPDVTRFCREAMRVLKPGGCLAMIEPANTPWARMIYQRCHHEPFDPSRGWAFESSGPLSGANGALPWIVFVRDRARFGAEFPALHVARVECHTPFRYLLSGGVSMRQLVPDWSFRPLTVCERVAGPLNNLLGMFMTIHVRKNISTQALV